MKPRKASRFMDTEQEPKRITLRLDEITKDPVTQARVQTDQSIVDEYAEVLSAGGTLPPIDVMFDDVDYYIFDGWHRFLAHLKKGALEIKCNVYCGTREEAQWRAFAANKSHGLRRSNADKAKAVKLALQHPKGVQMSDSAIAVHVGVSPPTVAKYRSELESTQKVLESPSSNRVGRDGRTIKTEKIGRKSPNDELSSDPPTFTEDTEPVSVLDECEPAFDAAESFYSGEPDPDEESGPTLEDLQSEFDAFIRELGVNKAKVRRIAEQNAAGAWLDENRLDEFDRRLSNVQAVLKVARPHAVCTWCGGAKCEKCRQTGFLPQSAAESAPTAADLAKASGSPVPVSPLPTPLASDTGRI